MAHTIPDPGTASDARGPDCAKVMPLPLHVCQVLEEEYAVLHEQPTNLQSWDFDETHFFTVDTEQAVGSDRVSPASELLSVICPDLRPHREEGWTCVDPHSPFSSHLAGLIGRRPLPALAQSPPARLLAQLLNGILDSPDLFEYSALAGTLWRKETEQLCAARLTKRTFGGPDLRRFNRLLLEDAYPRVIKRIYDLRLADIITRIHAVPGPPRAALCLSGGGIRSGTFALGVLQGLARHDLLRHFHYLSTVSGGGYVGSWFTAWCHRHPRGLEGVSGELRSLRTSKKVEPEPEPVRRLREYSNFVAIRPHLLSADVWSFVAIYLRNVLINWLVFIPLLLAVLLGPRIAVALLYVDPADRWTLPWRSVGGTLQGTLLVLGFALSIAAIFYVTINRPSLEDLLARRRFWYGRRTQGHVLAFSVLPTIASGLCLSLFWAWFFRQRRFPCGEGRRPGRGHLALVLGRPARVVRLAGTTPADRRRDLRGNRAARRVHARLDPARRAPVLHGAGLRSHVSGAVAEMAGDVGRPRRRGRDGHCRRPGHVACAERRLQPGDHRTKQPCLSPGHLRVSGRARLLSDLFSLGGHVRRIHQPEECGSPPRPAGAADRG